MYITGKKADYFRYHFTHAEGRTLYDVYSEPSKDKIRAYEQCREKCYSQFGYNFRVMTHSRQSFTCGWITGCFGKNILHVETLCNSYEMEY